MSDGTRDGPGPVAHEAGAVAAHRHEQRSRSPRAGVHDHLGPLEVQPPRPGRVLEGRGAVPDRVEERGLRASGVRVEGEPAVAAEGMRA